MEIDKAVKIIQMSLTPLEKKILKHIINTNEVFTNKELSETLNIDRGTVRRCTWRLHRDKHIFRYQVGNIRYYGSESSINQLRLKLNRGS
mgnify:CR=1 FL=1